MPAVEFKDVDIVFGGDRKAALAMIDRGSSRDEIIAATRSVPGAMKINLAVEPGQICVLMGLSGSGRDRATSCRPRGSSRRATAPMAPARWHA